MWIVALHMTYAERYCRSEVRAAHCTATRHTREMALCLRLRTGEGDLESRCGFGPGPVLWLPAQGALQERIEPPQTRRRQGRCCVAAAQHLARDAQAMQPCSERPCARAICRSRYRSVRSVARLHHIPGLGGGKWLCRAPDARAYRERRTLRTPQLSVGYQAGAGTQSQHHSPDRSRGSHTLPSRVARANRGHQIGVSRTYKAGLVIAGGARSNTTCRELVSA